MPLTVHIAPPGGGGGTVALVVAVDVRTDGGGTHTRFSGF